VKQAVEDLLVFLYLVELYRGRTELELSKHYLLSVLEIFPDSAILYIVYGILEEDPAIKTGAFLKCIEMDNNVIFRDKLECSFCRLLGLSLPKKQKPYGGCQALFEKC